MLKLRTDELSEKAHLLHAGDEVLLSGVVYTARDAAHKLLTEGIKNGTDLPFELKGAVIYYAGPTQTPVGQVCGSFGPTTSCRMDAFTPTLLEKGVAATIGKGGRSDAVTNAVVQCKSPYFVALGGAGALAASHITACDVIGYEHLGCESIKRLEFKDFPLFVATDIYGKSIYDLGGKV